MKAAILLTCFNRKEKTLECLKSILEQSRVDGLTIKIFLVDDGSTDGTSSAVKNDYPEVNVLQGSGNLYWNGGMNFAWETAIKEFFDFYIWINDDISPISNAFSIMFDAHTAAYSAHNTDSVIVGCFCEADNTSHAYGGFHVKKTLLAITKTPILPSNTVRQCDTFNGNLVLIPKSVVNKIGLLDKRYTHSFGDIDYGLRCTANDIPIFITPGYVGACPRNPTKNSWFDPSMPLSQRYKKLLSPTGLPPSEYFYSYKKESAYIAGYLALIKLYLRLLMPKLWSKLPRNGIEK